MLWKKVAVNMLGKINIGLVLVAACAALAVFVLPGHLAWGLVAAGVIIAAVGTLDERHRLSPGQQLVGQLLAASMLVAAGWTIPYVTNPLGPGVLMLGSWGGLLAMVWLIGLMNAVNWLDGVDGLAGGVGLIVFLALAAVSLLPAFADGLAFRLSIIGAGVTLAFLLGNWPPARIYLGTTGAWWLGLFLGVVAMAGRGKITATALVLAWPLIDAAAVVMGRLRSGVPIWQGDKQHFHHRLLAAGLSPGRISTVAMLVSALVAAGVIGLAAWRANNLVDCRDFSQGKIRIEEQYLRVAIARTFEEHAQGLSRCEQLPAGSGMYFVFASKQTPVFWMQGMLFPLDIIWIADNKVVGISANVPAPADQADPNPARVGPPQPIDAVLEIAAGEAAKAGILVDSVIDLN